MEMEIKRNDDLDLGGTLEKEHWGFANQYLRLQLLGNVHIEGHTSSRMVGIGGNDGAGAKSSRGRGSPGIRHEGGIASASTPDRDIVYADEGASLGILLDEGFIKEFDDFDDIGLNLNRGRETDGFGIDGTERAHYLLSVSHR